MSPPPSLPRNGSIWLSLSEEVPSNGFHLEIPIPIINANCRHPINYLRYLAWCILSRRVTIWTWDGHCPDEAGIQNRGIYVVRLEQGADWYSSVVDPTAMKHHSESQTATGDHEGLRDIILPRDKNCVFSDADKDVSQACHILPFARGDGWLTAINTARQTNYLPEDLAPGIDTRQNGILLFNPIHTVFDEKRVAIMKIPNEFISLDDVELNLPDNKRLEDMASCGKIIFSNFKYVIQWIKPLPNQRKVDMVIPNNTVASFGRNTRRGNTPSSLLLDYHYGAAAITHWGKAVDKLSLPAYMPVPVDPVPVGPTSIWRSGTELDQVLDRRKQIEDNHGEGPSSHSHCLSGGETSEHESGPYTPQQQNTFSSGQGYATQGFTVEEAEELVFGFWISTPKAQAEHKREEDRKNSKVDKWRKEVS